MKPTAFLFILSVIFISIFTVTLSAATVDLEVSVSNPFLLANQEQSIFLKVGLTGSDLGEERRTPANVSIVLDRSGSMDGEKIARAKEAASMAISMLDDRDIVSIVTYSDTVSVLIPATRVSDRSYIQGRIESVFADGSTALFAGVSKGADEVSKFLERNSVNRVILLSDGLANIGPDSPGALGSLGESLKKSGVSVTTIGLGLGYNEDLMVQLAQKSDGNHAFVENYNDLARIFRYEFQDILSVVAQDVEIEITCPEGVLPLRIMGREAEIIGNKVYTTINQLYSNQEKYLLVELTIPPNQAGSRMDI
ncbi:MAG: VWA domain-containing protein, partial [Spirochaetales bacterium]|nr:VWA domain-containing protein [Spirochaetales bacterium]